MRSRDETQTVYYTRVYAWLSVYVCTYYQGYMYMCVCVYRAWEHLGGPVTVLYSYTIHPDTNGHQSAVTNMFQHETTNTTPI